MLSVTPMAALYFYTRPTDIRKGFDSLCSVVRQELETVRSTGACSYSSTAAATG